MKIFTHFWAIICIFASGSFGVPSVHIYICCKYVAVLVSSIPCWTCTLLILSKFLFILILFCCDFWHLYIYIYTYNIFSFCPSVCLSLLFFIFYIYIYFLKCANSFYRYCLPTSCKSAQRTRYSSSKMCITFWYSQIQFFPFIGMLSFSLYICVCVCVLVMYIIMTCMF